MATKTHPHVSRSCRRAIRRVGDTVAGHWLVVLSHTIAVIVLLVLDRILHVPSCGGG
jgi:hypothetical protein